MSQKFPFGNDTMDPSSKTLTDDHKKRFVQQVLEKLDARALKNVLGKGFLSMVS